MDDPNGIVRQKAAELEVAARRARLAGTALNIAVAVLVLAAAGFSAWNTQRLKEISERVEADAQFNRELVRVIQNFNAAHATAAGESFDTLNENLRCMFDWMADFNTALATNAGGGPQVPLPDRARLDACFRPVTPQPAPPPEPPKERRP